MVMNEKELQRLAMIEALCKRGITPTKQDTAWVCKKLRACMTDHKQLIRLDDDDINTKPVRPSFDPGIRMDGPHSLRR